ncbi:MAG: recombinase family protein [Armatimonadota bacterium]
MHETPSADEAENRTLPTVAYVRMSTEHQQYSTENQMDIIREYAERRHMEIIRIYSDEGKSGLGIQWRGGLQSLINDVQIPDRDFEVILAYDVSRWGRFQDADESGYYEFICRKAGVQVHYCAEQFVNDGSPVANIVKSVKRSMAGEYSRELSAKVFKGQCTLIEKGFRQGGPAGFGLRRALIDEQRTFKGLLDIGEHKSIQTDRVILLPGPPEEIEVVRQLYRWFIVEGLREIEIAERLNTQGVRTDHGREWTRSTIHQVLTNEKYIGNNVYNRMSFKLKQRRIKNPPEMLIRANGVFDPIIDIEQFIKAREIIDTRCRRYTNEELLEFLKGLWHQHGRLTALVIDEHDGPSSTAYRSRFGSLIRAYKLIGYIPGYDYSFLEINKRLRELHPQVVERVISGIVDLGGSVSRDEETDLLEVNNEFTASLIISRCKHTDAGSRRWVVRFDTALNPDITIAARMDPENSAIMDYYLLPITDISGERLRLAEQNGLYFDSYRFDDLDYLFYLARRASLLEVM